MAAADDFSPLVERVLELLCEGASGVMRPVLDELWRKSTGRHAAEDEAPSTGELPTLTLELTGLHDGSPIDEAADRWRYAIGVEIHVTYLFGGGDSGEFPSAADRRSLSTRAHNHHLKIRGVLCHPNNLDTLDRDGASTGLASGKLNVGAPALSLSWRAQTLVAISYFTGIVDITPPT